jgi:transcription elongation factor Elf1
MADMLVTAGAEQPIDQLAEELDLATPSIRVSRDQTLMNVLLQCLEHVMGTSHTPAAAAVIFDVGDSGPLPLSRKTEFYSHWSKATNLAKRGRQACVQSRGEQPIESHEKELQRMIRCIRRSKYLGIGLAAAEGPSDVAALQGVYGDMRSHTEIEIGIGPGTVFCGSCEQKLTESSSAESKSDSTEQVIWTREFMKSQRARRFLKTARTRWRWQRQE